MDRLRGTGTTFSTSGKRWFPFRGNPKLVARHARLRRLKRAGLTPPADKASAREMCAEACRTHPVRKAPDYD